MQQCPEPPPAAPQPPAGVGAGPRGGVLRRGGVGDGQERRGERRGRRGGRGGGRGGGAAQEEASHPTAVQRGAGMHFPGLLLRHHHLHHHGDWNRGAADVFLARQRQRRQPQQHLTPQGNEDPHLIAPGG